MFAHSRDPHPAIKLWCQVPFTQSKTIFQIDMYWIQCFLKSKCIKRRVFNDKNRWIIKKVMVLKKLFPHPATRGTYYPGDWRCGETWREQTLVYPPVMCRQRLSYCTWELNVMMTVHHYRSRQFHRTSNGENPSSVYRDMGSTSPAAARPPGRLPWPLWQYPFSLEGWGVKCIRGILPLFSYTIPLD